MKTLQLLLPIFLLSGTAMAADDMTRHEPDTNSGITFALENDLFNGRDDGYTNGVRAAYMSPEDEMPYWLSSTVNNIPFFARDGHKRWHLEVGQSMFAPEDLTISTLQANDRPYAGWLYGSVGVISDTGSRLDNLQLTLGMVGPASGAAEAQRVVHKIVGAPIPQGWGHQLNNEPGVMLTYERKWRNMYELTPFGMGVDITPSMGGSVGNVYTHASVGAIARIGYDLPSDYGPPVIRPNLPGSDFFKPSGNVSWYFFAGVEGRAVGHNIFLDGNSFTESHSVDKNLFVGGAQAGVAITYKSTRLAYTQIFRTREFEGQPRNDQFGALTLSVRY